MKVFTTRPDTLMGVTYVALAPEHPLVSRITPPHQQEAVQNFVKEILSLNEVERIDLNRSKRGKFFYIICSFACLYHFLVVIIHKCILRRTTHTPAHPHTRTHTHIKHYVLSFLSNYGFFLQI
jgi:leucyl-tRNA synthetase